jgi:hypothetical protein
MVSIRTQIVPFDAARQVRAETTVQSGGNISSNNVQGALQNLDTAVQNAKGQLTPITAAGTVTISATQPGVAIDKTVGAPTTVQLPAAASRNGLPVIVKDMKGDAGNGTNSITVLPNGAETIDGESQDVIDVNLASRTYRPISGGWLRT